jgi:hypothetical protein
MACRHVELKSTGEQCGCQENGWPPPLFDPLGSLLRVRQPRFWSKPLAYRPLADILGARRLIGFETLSCKDEPMLVSRTRGWGMVGIQSLILGIAPSENELTTVAGTHHFALHYYAARRLLRKQFEQGPLTY